MKNRHFRVLVLLSLNAFFISSCATSPQRDKRFVKDVTTLEQRTQRADVDQIARHIEMDDVDSKKVFANAENAYAAGEVLKASHMYMDFIKRYPDSVMADDAYFRIGEIQFGKGQYEGSIESFQKILSDYPGSDLLLETKFRLSISLFKKGEYNDAIQTLKGLIGSSLDDKRKVTVMTTIADSYLNLSMNRDALIWYSKALGISPGEKITDKIEKRIINVVLRNISSHELPELQRYFSGAYVGDVVIYAGIMQLINEGKYDEAKINISNIISKTRSETIRFKAREGLELIAQRMDVKSDTIGCILPLSGRYAPYGQKMLKGIQLAAGVFSAGEGGTPLNLVIKDSGGDADEAIKLVDELIDNDKVVAIVGPLLSKVAESAANRAQERGVPMVTLSKQRDITTTGDYIFRNFFTSKLQTKSLVDYSVNNLGIKKFAILYPKDRFGEEMMSLFWNDVLLFGGEVVAIEGYESTKYDFAKEIKHLVGMSRVDKKAEEKKDEVEKVFPVIDFQALFIPDSYNKAAVIAPQLVYNDVKNIQLIGPNSWNSYKLVEMGGEYIEGAIFSVGFYADSEYEGARLFTENFMSVFGEKPGTLEAQSFDAAMMIIQYMKRGEAKSRIEMRDKLLSISNFMGATGRSTITETGDTEKKLFIMTVNNGEITEVDDASWFAEENVEEEAPLLQ